MSNCVHLMQARGTCGYFHTFHLAFTFYVFAIFYRVAETLGVLVLRS